MKEFWGAVREALIQARGCSRCIGVALALVVVVLSAIVLDAQAVKEIMLAGMSLATALVMHGAGTQTLGRTIDAQNTATAAVATAGASARNEVDPNASRNG